MPQRPPFLPRLVPQTPGFQSQVSQEHPSARVRLWRSRRHWPQGVGSEGGRTLRHRAIYRVSTGEGKGLSLPSEPGPLGVGP